MEIPKDSTTPSYKQIQLEVTSRCNLRCTTCLYAYFEPQWQAQDLSEDLFQKVLGIAHRCESVHLQGWGESLLRQDCPDLIKQLKNGGCQVTLSSNGTIMDSSMAQDLIQAGLDSMAFSFAGTSARMQDPLRGHGTFDAACEAVKLFARARPAKSSPPLVLNILLTPDTVRTLPGAVTLCARLGADILYAGHMVQAVVPEQEKMVARKLYEQNQWKVFLSRFSVLWHRVTLKFPSITDAPVPMCPKNPLENLFIGSDGSVSPCVYLNPPLKGPYTSRINGKSIRMSRVIMGNLNDHSLDSIWNCESYRSFRQAFKDRILFYDAMMSGVVPDLSVMEKLERARDHIQQRFTTSFMPPQACRHCTYLERG